MIIIFNYNTRFLFYFQLRNTLL